MEITETEIRLYPNGQDNIDAVINVLIKGDFYNDWYSIPLPLPMDHGSVDIYRVMEHVNTEGAEKVNRVKELLEKVILHPFGFTVGGRDYTSLEEMLDKELSK